MTHVADFWYLVLLVAVATASNVPNATIVGVGVQTLNGEPFSGGIHCCIAMNLAVQNLNNRPNASVHYNLVFVDNQDEASTAVRGVVSQWLADPSTIGYIGDYYSFIAIAEQSFLAGFSIPQIGYGDTSPSLSDKTSYPFFLRTIISDAARGSVFAYLLQYFRWQEIAVVSFNEPFSQGLRQSFNGALPSLEVEVSVLVDFEFASTSVTNAEASILFPQILSQNIHVILLMAVSSAAIAMLSIATSLDMVGPNYQWILADFQNDEYVGLIDILNRGPDTGTPFSNSFFAAYYNNSFPQCNPDLSFPPGNVTIDTYTIPAYDAVTAFSLASEQILATTGNPTQLSNGSLMLSTLLQLNFQGLNLPISFNEDGDVLTGEYEVVIYIPNGSQAIGSVKVNSSSAIVSFLDSNQVSWPTSNGPVLAPLLCAAGYESGASANGSSCIPCLQGYYAAARGDTCSQCPPGQISRSPAATSCDVCNPGTHATSTQDDCVVCDSSSYAPLPSAVSCTPCPSNSSTGILGATDISDCICLPGFFPLPNTTILECVECAVGAVCNGQTLPYAASGYFRQDINTFYICNPSSSCVNNECTGLLTGDMCASCVDGLLYDTETASCVQCSFAGSVTIILIVGAIACFLAYWISKPKKGKDNEDQNVRIGTLRNHAYGRSIITNISILITFLQIQSIIGGFALKISATRQTFLTMQFMLGDLQQIYSCLFLSFSVIDDSLKPFWSVFQWKLIFPALIPIFLITFWLLDQLHRGYHSAIFPEIFKWTPPAPVLIRTPSGMFLSSEQSNLQNITVTTMDVISNAVIQMIYAIRLRVYNLLTRYRPMSPSAAVNAALMLSDFLYLGEVNVALSIFNCYIQPDGQFSIVVKPDVLCYQGDWSTYSISAYFAAVIYGLGVPLLFAVCLLVKYLQDTKRMTKINWIDVDVAFACLVTNYNPSTFWWHLVIQLKKMFISVVVGLVPDLAARTALAMLVIAVVLAATLIARPFLFRTGLLLESVALCCHIVTLSLALVQHYNSLSTSVITEATSSSDIMINNAVTFMFSFTVAIFGLTLLYDVWRYIRSLSRTWNRQQYLRHRLVVDGFVNRYDVRDSESLSDIVEVLWEDRYLLLHNWLKFLAEENPKSEKPAIQPPAEKAPDTELNDF